MSHSLLLEGSRVQILNQLVYFDEDLTFFLDQYFPEHNQKRYTVEKTIQTYSTVLEEILKDLNPSTLHSVALIGSRVKLLYLDDNSTELFTIVVPSHADPDKNKISFLSPIGFQLLMARRNETYELVIPSGVVHVRVEDIEFYNSGDVN
jgi:transcription elongation factor GreA